MTVEARRKVNRRLSRHNAKMAFFIGEGGLTDADTAEVLKTLAQETRLAIFRLLMRSPDPGLSAGVISATIDIAPALASFHLKELCRGRLVKRQFVGRFAMYSADRAQFDALASHLSSELEGADIERATASPPGPARP